MKKYLLIFLIAVSIGLYFLYLQSTKTIAPKEAYEKLDDNKYVFVDVREKKA